MLTSTGRPHRRSLRLAHFDYRSAAIYFVTICTDRRRRLFWNADRSLSRFGQIAAEEWRRTEQLRSGVVLDEFVIMPDHMHGLLYLGHTRKLPREQNETILGSVIRGFKAAVTSRCRIMESDAHFQVWQRNYYEHIVRADKETELIRDYIWANPELWPEEPAFPSAADELGPR